MSQPNVKEETGPDLPGLTCLELIGSGGFADVFLYERDQPRIRVAVKLMKPNAIDDSKRRQFAAEADAMAELAEHPYIVPVLGAGTAPDGRPYLIMRYYQSSDLATKVATQPLSVSDALRLGVQLASAVETAHRAGIIHRDIKPSNILVSSYGQPGLSDFGIAGRPSDGDVDDEDIGVSIPWSPPEVLTGASNGSVTSDVYSLAATVWHLLVGRAPFYVPGGDNGERATFTRIVHSRPPTTGRDDAPASLDRLLQQALAKDPAHRPQSALELARHFQRIEQELRLARTEAVLLDQAGSNVAASQPATTTNHPGPVVANGPTLDETPLGLTSSEAAACPVIADAPTVRPPRRVDSAQADSREPRRQWKSVETAREVEDQSAEPAQTPHNRDDELSRPTELRPRSTGSVQSGVENSDPAPRVSRRWLLVATAVVAVLVVGIGMILGRGGHQPDQAGKSPRQATDTNLGDVAPGAPADPSVRYRVTGDRVIFTWQPVTGAIGYEWTSASGRSHRTKGTRVTVPKSSSGRTCITVSSLGGAGTPASSGRGACAP
jgi:serine/threonine protein kinase